MRLADFERAGAVFSSALNREYYLQGAGLKPQLEISPIYDNFRRLFDLETFHEIRTMLTEDVRSDQYRRFLLDFVASSYLENGVKERSEAIAQAEATTLLPWGERDLTYRATPVVWTNEPDADRRHELNQLWREATEALNPHRS